MVGIAACAGIALVGGSPLPIGAQTPTPTDSTVAALRAEADRAAGEYFDALARAEELAQSIATLERRLPELAAERRTLRTAAEARAVAAYKRAGNQLNIVFASADALTAARRVTWLGQLNARDNSVFTELAIASDALEAQRTELRSAQAAQQETLTALAAHGRDIDAKLQAAEDRARELAAQAAARASIPRPVNPGTGPGGAPPAPPPDYVPTPGEHPRHNDPFLVCTRAHEGTYTSYNPAGPYMGAYQFLQSTWNSSANRAGRSELIGVPPHTASAYDQDDVAWALYQWQGSRPWGGRCG
ncbi:MAG TPA: hypothetical protein VFW06_10035 [Acidimicrobiia bacterium]|nr:hypothetical protein [Acidimicrobiia bacterium]